MDALTDEFASAISIHALRVEGDCSPECLAKYRLISIHALRVEGDIILPRIRYDRRKISIHALRVEGDSAFVAP